MSEIVTGTDAIRQTMRSWAVKLSTASLAQDLGISAADLDGFVAGTRLLPADVLTKLVKILFQGHAIYDQEIDRLRMAPGPEPTSMGVPPDRYVPPANAPRYEAGGAPNLYPASKPQQKPTRPGWA